ncbi:MULTISPECIES: biotin transporter BioY [unclassified Corynebacterium]|uniref:biotin transporter BioY n=1 Tax=unclassified Corynebacterium TaxID=2624378 RepID=UPI002103EC7D|nr:MULTISPECIES: biotin transporter BioY [unclassified Corynebacterium]
MSHSETTKIKAVDLAYIAVFAALIIVLGGVQLPIGVAGVPIVLQNMGIVLASLILGFWRGGLATTLFIAVGFVGVPNMAGWKPAAAAVAGPTVGYIVGYVIAAFVIGLIAQYAPRNTNARAAVFFLAGILGVIIQYLCGSIGLMARLGYDLGTALAANTPFIPGDLIKVTLAVAIALAVTKAVPDLLPTKRKA